MIRILVAVVLGMSAAAVWSADAPLATAAEAGDSERVSALLAKNVPVNEAQVDGMTALHWAVHHDDLKLAQALVTAKADVNATNNYGVRALSLSCQNGNAALTSLLLSAGADPNASLKGGETPLMTAARTGCADCVRVLLDHGAKPTAVERRQQTAIMWAAAEGHPEVVKILLKAGADFREPLASGFTPFLFAVREGHAEVVQVLLEAGVDVNAVVEPSKGGGGRLPARMSALHLAVENGHLDLAIELIKAGADPNDQRIGYTALHNVTWVRKTGFGDNEAGNPAPRISGRTGTLEFVRQLVSLGADVDARINKGAGGRGRMSRKGATPFLLGSKNADLPFLKLLVELGADPLMPNAEGCTPLMAAAGIGCLAPGEEAGTELEAMATVRYLVSLKADLNAVDKNGETAMHGAAYKSLPQMVHLLDELGAKITVWNRKNRYGWTPLVIAQGFRPGNFKPAHETIEAISAVMRSHGVTPPPPPKRKPQGWQE